MKISKPNVEVEDSYVECNYTVQKNDYEEVLWFRLNEKYRDLISERSDTALVGLLIPAMKSGEDIRVEGTISERLYYTLSRPLQHAFQAVMPELQIVDIDPENVKSESERASGVAMGFSGGIDSFSALADHYYSNTPSGYRVTHLLFNNVGSHGSGGERLFRERYERLSSTVEDIGLPLVAVNSNLDSFYDGFSFKQTHSPRNTAVALLLQNGIGRFYYGSAYQYNDIFVGKTDAIAHTDPVMLPLLSTEKIDVLPVGTEYTRVEKTLQVAEIEDSYQSLNICTDASEAGNCSVCNKCRRTILTLEIAGKLNRYSDVFDYNTYKKRRWLYMTKVLEANNPYSREISNFADLREFNFPAYSRALSKLRLFATYEELRALAVESPTVRKVAKRVLSVVE